MTTTHIAAPTAVAATTGSLAKGGLVAVVVASAATAIVAAAGQAVGISLDIEGAPIPVSGFAMLTAVFSVIGLVIAAVLRRVARRPRLVFVRTTVVLTALSFVPDLLADAAPATKVLLMLTHLVAAAIVIPAVARRLPARLAVDPIVEE
ncbi:DUF6069 family protein [Pseudonocardia sp. GCM10023141]|uniref:DUF6069 family protein n=1 Tax=Pseudonocardia sp. GCM10023141 TaxID=3252653 RepID=UPI0036106C92